MIAMEPNIDFLMESDPCYWAVKNKICLMGGTIFTLLVFLRCLLMQGLFAINGPNRVLLKFSPAHNDSLFIVPEGRQFVIRRIYSAPELTLSLDWYLAADNNSILDGSINLVGTGPTGHIYSFKHDFPDLCLTIDSLETLNAVNNTDGPLGMTVIGYFRSMP